MLVETSPVTVQGLKILGMPAIETPKPGLKRRLYAIARCGRTFDDLDIAPCVFANDKLIASASSHTVPAWPCAIVGSAATPRMRSFTGRGEHCPMRGGTNRPLELIEDGGEMIIFTLVLGHVYAYWTTVAARRSN